MKAIQPQVIKDDKGNEVGVFLPMEEYNRLMEEIEELEDIRLYDEAKKNDEGERISHAEYVALRKKRSVKL